MTIPRPSRAIAVNHKICKGCGLCELACSLLHEGECNPSLSRIHVLKDRENYRFKLRVCLQCRVARCREACPNGAIKMENGTYVIVEELCTGCGLCAEACPFNSESLVIFLHPSKAVCVKCDLCLGRNELSCVGVCPTGALAFKS